MRVFRALKFRTREAPCHAVGNGRAAASDAVDPWAELEEQLRVSRAIREEARRRVLDAVARLHELARNPPR
jgi:hypothetical protein